MPLNESVVESVVNSNFKNIAEMGAITAGVASQNLVSHTRTMDGLREAFIAESTLQRAGADPAEALSQTRIISADQGKVMAELGAAVAALQQIVKTAQSTPPVTP